jgi:drug/metabolite transporter (DMT)-like permease
MFKIFIKVFLFKYVTLPLKKIKGYFLKILEKIDRGVLYMLLASLSFAFMGGFAKVVSSHLAGLEITFFRNIFGVLIIGFSIYRFPLKQKGEKPLLLLFRGLMGFLALLAYFYIIAYMPLGEVVTYNKTSPIFVAIFAYIFLGEKLNKISIFAIILGFIGIILIAKPFGGEFNIYDILGIFSGIGAALAYTSIRELRKYYDTRAIVMSFMGVGTIAPLILMLITPYINAPKELEFMFSEFILPTKKEFLYLTLMGLSATLSQYLMTKAYEHTKAGIVGTISYTNIIFAMIIGIFLGDSLPSISTILGIILVITSGLLVAFSKENR